MNTEKTRIRSQLMYSSVFRPCSSVARTSLKFQGGNPSMSFVAIDFETADRSLDSACAVALVKVENGQIIDRNYWLIRPPREEFRFTYLHGISWKNVADQPTFQELWP